MGTVKKARGVIMHEPRRFKIEKFPWKKDGAGWTAFVHASNEEKSLPATPPPSTLTVEPTGGLHGGWKWSFLWESGDGRPNVISGRHADPDVAKKQCEVCLKALLALSYKLAKKKFDEFVGDAVDEEEEF